MSFIFFQALIACLLLGCQSIAQSLVSCLVKGPKPTKGTCGPPGGFELQLASFFISMSNNGVGGR